MVKPNGYDNAKVQGEFTPVELGGHYLVIKGVEEMKSKNGKPMLKVYIDFAQNDKQSGYFFEQFKNDIQPNKKWPNQATQYILAEDDKGQCTSQIKTFCTCVEHSNERFSCWMPNGEFDFANIKNKKLGGVFGEQMDFYDGKEKKKRVLRWFCSSDKVTDAQIPDMSETAAYKAYKEKGGMPASPDGFMNIPDGIDEELPFN